MTQPSSVVEICAALDVYRAFITHAEDNELREDSNRLVLIAEEIVAALNSGDTDSARYLSFAFSRAVSDSYATQPQEFKALSNAIEKHCDP
jgi:hypothetical protein